MMLSINSFKAVDLLRIRGFLHAFHLVEMTTKKSTVISSVVERSPGKDTAYTHGVMIYN